MDATLFVIEGKASRSEITLKLPTVVGRRKDSGLVIMHKSVSRQHCELFEQQGRVCVRDIHSSNGTYVNGHKVVQKLLRPGDKLRVGPLLFRVEYVPDRVGGGSGSDNFGELELTPAAGFPGLPHAGELPPPSSMPRANAPPPKSAAKSQKPPAQPVHDDALNEDSGFGFLGDEEESRSAAGMGSASSTPEETADLLEEDASEATFDPMYSDLDAEEDDDAMVFEDPAEIAGAFGSFSRVNLDELATLGGHNDEPSAEFGLLNDPSEEMEDTQGALHADQNGWAGLSSDGEDQHWDDEAGNLLSPLSAAESEADDLAADEVGLFDPSGPDDSPLTQLPGSNLPPTKISDPEPIYSDDQPYSDEAFTAGLAGSDEHASFDLGGFHNAPAFEGPSAYDRDRPAFAEDEDEEDDEAIDYAGASLPEDDEDESSAVQELPVFGATHAAFEETHDISSVQDLSDTMVEHLPSTDPLAIGEPAEDSVSEVSLSDIAEGETGEAASESEPVDALAALEPAEMRFDGSEPGSEIWDGVEGEVVLLPESASMPNLDIDSSEEVWPTGDGSSDGLDDANLLSFDDAAHGESVVQADENSAVSAGPLVQAETGSADCGEDETVCAETECAEEQAAGSDVLDHEVPDHDALWNDDTHHGTPWRADDWKAPSLDDDSLDDLGSDDGEASGSVVESDHPRAAD